MLRLLEGVCTAGGWSANDVAEPALRCRRRLCDDELPEQPAESLGLQGLQVKSQEMIAQGALLLVPEQIGLQHLSAALWARHPERHGAASTLMAPTMATRRRACSSPHPATLRSFRRSGVLDSTRPDSRKSLHHERL